MHAPLTIPRRRDIVGKRNATESFENLDGETNLSPEPVASISRMLSRRVAVRKDHAETS